VVTLSAPIAVLDTVPLAPGSTRLEALASSTQLALAAEASGCTRIWVSEHHASANTACSSPPIMIAHLAAHTSRIRVGSGGVMLSNHTAMTVAEQFTMLQALHSGRVDLGIGRAPGGEPLAIRALTGREAEDPAYFADKLDDLFHFFEHSFPASHQWYGLELPLRVRAPPVFLLGASESGAGFAAGRGLPFVYAHFQNAAATLAASREYRERFRPSRHGDRPHLMVAVRVVCRAAASEAETAALAACAWNMSVGIPERLKAHLNPEAASEDEMVRRLRAGTPMVVGTPDSVARQLWRLAVRTGANELLIAPYEYEGVRRIATVRDVASAYGDLARSSYDGAA
jgi:luciferase family oxidoreductase group 1